MKMIKTDVYLTKEQIDRIQSLQKKVGGMTRAEIIRRAIDFFLDKGKKVN